jgi:hypothetical protein
MKNQKGCCTEKPIVRAARARGLEHTHTHTGVSTLYVCYNAQLGKRSFV